MNPIHEIILRSRPDQLIEGSYTGYCPLHDDPNPCLSFKDMGKNVEIFCHHCHYIGRTAEEILSYWGLGPENLFVARTMNPIEAEITLCRSNMIRLSLEAQKLHYQVFTPVIRKRYRELINEKTKWFERLEKAQM